MALISGKPMVQWVYERSVQLSSFAPGMGARADGLQSEIFAIGTLRRDRYRGGRAVELVAETLED